MITELRMSATFCSETVRLGDMGQRPLPLFHAFEFNPRQGLAPCSQYRDEGASFEATRTRGINNAVLLVG